MTLTINTPVPYDDAIAVIDFYWRQKISYLPQDALYAYNLHCYRKSWELEKEQCAVWYQLKGGFAAQEGGEK